MHVNGILSMLYNTARLIPNRYITGNYTELLHIHISTYLHVHYVIDEINIPSPIVAQALFEPSLHGM